MDDTCAVCAETLEWVAYGACGHREVCSTCVSRLRLICEDRRCCICKTESQLVFVTKALGDYTTTISDFSVFPSEATEGKNGSYWYHEDTGAYFDDFDHYKMIKEMCRLSCSVCDKIEGNERGIDGLKRQRMFRNIQQLKSHLYHQHKLVMCILCLEGRKVFICEQKLYTGAQLNQHINTGDSEVDGNVSERGGFMGHPMCNVCGKRVYGDNELYLHKSTEHYTCHICQRQNPGQFDYYKTYDDLEMHFRSKHFLCENEACLAKKFIVFVSEFEMKRHNTLEHGGNMTRSMRNAALQIPTSFHYRRTNEQDDRRGRGRGFRPDPPENEDSLATPSLDVASTESTNYDPSCVQSVPGQNEHGIDEIVPLIVSMDTTDAEGSFRYLQALGQSSRDALEESSFPPLAMAPPSTQQKPNNKGLVNTMAARLRRCNSPSGTTDVLNSAKSWSARNHGLASFSTHSQAGTVPNHGVILSSVSSSSPTKAAITNAPSSPASSALAGTTPSHGLVSSSISAHSAQARLTASPSASSGTPSWKTKSTSRVSHSILAPKPIGRGSLDSSLMEFPPIPATQKNMAPSSSPSKVEDVHTANNSLTEVIRAALEFDENKYTAFKDLSEEYRQNMIGAGEYLSYVQQFGLSHLVLELTRLFQNPQKQRELLETYNASVRCDSDTAQENGLSTSGIHPTGSKGSNKSKGKHVKVADGGSKTKLVDRSLDGPSSNYASSVQTKTTMNHGLVSTSISASSSQTKTKTTYASSAQARPTASSSASLGSSSWNKSSTSRVSNSVSTPNSVQIDSSRSEFPPIPVTQKSTLTSRSPPKAEDVDTANQSVEEIMSALEFDENKYTAFKELSGEYRQGTIGAGEYLSYVQQFGLSHLILELARLFPDPRKQRELLDTYNASVRERDSETTQVNGLSTSSIRPKKSEGSSKGQGKYLLCGSG